MSKTKHKKRHPQGKRGYTTAPVAESEFATDGTRKRMNPTARNLLFVALICLAISEILLRMELLSGAVSLIISIAALVALVVAMYLQFRKQIGRASCRERV